MRQLLQAWGSGCGGSVAEAPRTQRYLASLTMPTSLNRISHEHGKVQHPLLRRGNTDRLVQASTTRSPARICPQERGIRFWPKVTPSALRR